MAFNIIIWYFYIFFYYSTVLEKKIIKKIIIKIHPNLILKFCFVVGCQLLLFFYENYEKENVCVNGPHSASIFNPCLLPYVPNTHFTG